MTRHTNKNFSERLRTAADAKKTLVEKFRARPPADDPAVVARQQARRAISDAREARKAEQEATRRAQDAQEAAEREARQMAEQEQRTLEAAEALAREAALEVERKAARDARDAARKARQ
jgi:ABC-type branched-subunit amino acid transport system ATPase component